MVEGAGGYSGSAFSAASHRCFICLGEVAALGVVRGYSEQSSGGVGCQRAGYPVESGWWYGKKGRRRALGAALCNAAFKQL